MEPPAQCPQHSAYWTHSAAALCKMQYLLPTWWKRRVHVCAWLQQALRSTPAQGFQLQRLLSGRPPGHSQKGPEPHFNVRYAQPYGGPPSSSAWKFPKSWDFQDLQSVDAPSPSMVICFFCFLTQSAQSGFDDFIWNWNLLHPPYYLFLWLHGWLFSQRHQTDPMQVSGWRRG